MSMEAALNKRLLDHSPTDNSATDISLTDSTSTDSFPKNISLTGHFPNQAFRRLHSSAIGYFPEQSVL